jgi:hypothetical protein
VLLDDGLAAGGKRDFVCQRPFGAPESMFWGGFPSSEDTDNRSLEGISCSPFKAQMC